MDAAEDDALSRVSADSSTSLITIFFKFPYSLSSAAVVIFELSPMGSSYPKVSLLILMLLLESKNAGIGLSIEKYVPKKGEKLWFRECKFIDLSKVVLDQS